MTGTLTPDLPCIYNEGYTRGLDMAKSKVFRSGNSRAVRIPRSIELPLGEVEIFERGDEVVIRRARGSLADVPELLASLPEDFLADGRRDSRPQRRKGL